jgi:hypothetical protein
MSSVDLYCRRPVGGGRRGHGQPPTWRDTCDGVMSWKSPPPPRYAARAPPTPCKRRLRSTHTQLQQHSSSPPATHPTASAHVLSPGFHSALVSEYHGSSLHSAAPNKASEGEPSRDQRTTRPQKAPSRYMYGRDGASQGRG